MAKTVEQRIKELVTPTTRCYLVTNWTEMSSPYQKELNAPIFKGQGDVAALAKRYDAAADNFIKFDKQKDDAKKLFDDGTTALGKIKTQSDGLKKELEEVATDAGAAKQTVNNATKVEDMLNNWEETVKVMVDLNKERKAIFDRMSKLGEDYLKSLNDTIGKVKKAVDAAKSGLNSSNTELNALEGQIRSIIVKYQKTALDMDRKEIADAVRGFVTLFGS